MSSESENSSLQMYAERVQRNANAIRHSKMAYDISSQHPDVSEIKATNQEETCAMLSFNWPILPLEHTLINFALLLLLSSY